jgi:hypothetical protein
VRGNGIGVGAHGGQRWGSGFFHEIQMVSVGGDRSAQCAQDISTLAIRVRSERE